MKAYMKEILKVFFTINAGVTIGAAIFITFLQRDARLGVEILWQIILVSLLTAISTTIFYSKKELNKKQILIRTLMNYMSINAIVIGCGYLFHWINSEGITGVVSLIICIFFIYLFVCIITYKSDWKMAETLNKKIEEYNKENN